MIGKSGFIRLRTSVWQKVPSTDKQWTWRKYLLPITLLRSVVLSLGNLAPPGDTRQGLDHVRWCATSTQQVEAVMMVSIPEGPGRPHNQELSCPKCQYSQGQDHLIQNIYKVIRKKTHHYQRVNKGHEPQRINAGSSEG